jgi:hypothetical protein
MYDGVELTEQAGIVVVAGSLGFGERRLVRAIYGIPY